MPVNYGVRKISGLGQRPNYQVYNPENSGSYAEFGMTPNYWKTKEEKAKRIGAAARGNLASQKKSFYASKEEKPDLFHDNERFFNLTGWHTKYRPHTQNIESYIDDVGMKLAQIKEAGLSKYLTADDLFAIAGLPKNVAGGERFLNFVVKVASNKGVYNKNEKFRNFVNDTFMKFANGKDRDVVNNLGNQTWSDYLNSGTPLLNEKLNDRLISGSAESILNEQKYNQQLESEYEKEAEQKQLEKSAIHYGKKYIDPYTDDYLKGIKGESGLFEKSEEEMTPEEKRAQRLFNIGKSQRAEKNLEAYEKAQETPPTVKEQLKNEAEDKELYSAGFPKLEEPEPDNLLPEPKPNIEDLKAPEFPDLKDIIDPKIREQKEEEYNTKVAEHQKRIADEIRKSNIISQYNEMIKSRTKAGRKERQQKLADKAEEDNLALERKFIRDKTKEYKSALKKEAADKESKKFGLGDIYNSLRGGNNGYRDEESISLGGINRSLAAAQRAIGGM
jgi:hypothetical protein